MKIIIGIIAICGIATIQCELSYLGSRNNNIHEYLWNGRPITVHDNIYQRLRAVPADRAEAILIRIFEKVNPQVILSYKQDPTQAEIGESQTQNSFNKRPNSAASGNVEFPNTDQPLRPQIQNRPSTIGERPYANTQSNYGQSNDGLSPPETGFNRPIPSERDNEDSRGQGAVTDFAWKLFKSSNGPGNFVISPLSPQILLSYLAWVANGRTRKELQDVTGYGSPKPLQRLIESMLSDGKDRELQIATAFFTSKDMKLNKDFLDKSVNFADVVDVDFKNPSEAGRTISRWATSKTKGGLKLNEINYAPNTRIALTSAIYYKGKWIYTFEDAKPGQFFAENDRAVTVPMLSMNRKFHWGKIGDYAEWVAIDYESSEAMVIILPNEGQNVDNVINRMGGREIENVISGIDSESTKAKVNITMPKFKIESTTSLVEPLKKMGISTLFTPRAELPYLSDSDVVQVTNAQQQASMEVNEKGTVLIAFTNLNVVALSFQAPVPNVEFTVNRPFIALVADKTRRVPIMMAKITNPLA